MAVFHIWHHDQDLKNLFFFQISKNPSLKSFILMYSSIYKKIFSNISSTFWDFMPGSFDKNSFLEDKTGYHGNRTDHHGPKKWNFVKRPNMHI